VEIDWTIVATGQNWRAASQHWFAQSGWRRLVSGTQWLRLLRL